MKDNEKNNLTIKERIIDTAWKLFLEKGYDETTVDEIIEKSNTSKGSFYYHFSGKEEVLFCIAYYFDMDYKHWLKNLDPNLSSLEKLKELNYFVMKNIEDSPYRPLLATLYGLQVKTKSRRHILNPVGLLTTEFSISSNCSTAESAPLNFDNVSNFATYLFN